jgi:hypothetical protein
MKNQVPREAKAILFFCGAYVISKMWTVFHESTVTFDFFWFHDQPLTLRMHLWFICRIAEIIMIYCGITFLIEKFKNEITAILVLYILDLPDYLLIYQEALFYIGSIPIEFGMIKGVLMIIIALITYLKWKH